ncbi:hypothetical protein QL285_076775 [Trifolium repens]|nr:hypothetical protein QL285_076775 [Trifolium repens]
MGLSKPSWHDRSIVTRWEDTVQNYNCSCAFHQLGRQVRSSYHDEVHRSTMNRYFPDFLLLLSWRASRLHRGTMNNTFLHFLAFSCLFVFFALL